MQEPAPRRTCPPWPHWVLALLLFVGGTALLNWPLPRAMDHLYEEPTGDFGHNYWNAWWVARSIEQLDNPLETEILFHPEGASLLWRNLPLLPTALAAPFTLAFGPTFGFNLIFLATFVAAAFGAYLLAYHLTGSQLGALGAGFAYSFIPLHFVEYANQAYTHIQWLPLLLYALLRFKDEGRWRQAILAGVWLACDFHSAMYLSLYSGMALGLLYVYYLIAPGQRGIPLEKYLGGAGVALVTALMLTSFRAIPMVLETLGGKEIVPPTASTRSDLLGIRWRLDLNEPRYLVGWFGIFGYAVVLPALVGCFLTRLKRTLPWLILGAFFFLYSLGTELRILGKPYPDIPMLAEVFSNLPLFDVLRSFHRALMVTSLSLAVLFAFAIREWIQRQPGGLRMSMACILIALVAIEFRPPARAARKDPVPSFYHELAQVPSDGAVLTVPFDVGVAPGALQYFMFMQTAHQRPMISGYILRGRERIRRFMAQSEVLRRMMAQDLDDPTREIAIPDAETAARYREELRALGIEYVILQPQYIAEEGSIQQPPEIRLDWSDYLLPLWWGDVASKIVRPPLIDRGEVFTKFKYVWLHPSIVPYLEAVLGPAQRELEDGARVWAVPLAG